MMRNLVIISTFLLSFSACAKPETPIAEQLVPAPTSELSPGDTPESPTPMPATTLIESVVSQGVPEELARVAFAKYDNFSAFVQNTRYITMIDFTQHSGAPRMFMVETATGHVDSMLVAHGVNSDARNTGVPSRFSNVSGSKQSSLGAYIVAEQYVGRHGNSLRMDGLEATNDLARLRAIVLHAAEYVTPARAVMGRSWGCPAVSVDWINRTLDRLRNGSFLYIFGSGQNSATLDRTLMERMMLNPAFKWLDESAAPAEGE